MPRSPAIFVDLGTTNCRAWLVGEGRAIAKETAAVGVRDTAREGSKQKLHDTLRELIESLAGKSEEPPRVAVAAGMITSSLGLAEVPHVAAPAGLAEIASAVREHRFPEISALRFLLVPGVRTGDLGPGESSIGTADLMRGEETLCLGLIELGLVRGPATVLNLGSHWKAIRIDGQNRIAGSVTSMSGEMIHAMQDGTILASAVPPGRPTKLDPRWLDLGMREQRRAGLPRAMFCVRLLEQAGKGTAPQRMAFLVGAFIAADLANVMSEGAVAIVGTSALARAWKHALCGSNPDVRVVSEEQAEQALLAGLGLIMDQCSRANDRPRDGMTKRGK
jgi:2-dehydro-3-deoxygalactonokinase